MSMTLQGIVQWLLGGPRQRLSRARLARYLPEICQHHVPQVFLREHVIMEPEPQPGAEADEPVKLITVGRRHEEVTKIHELRAVRAACASILEPLVRGWHRCCGLATGVRPGCANQVYSVMRLKQCAIAKSVHTLAEGCRRRGCGSQSSSQFRRCHSNFSRRC